MAKIILDDCLQALYEAELSMADYVELTSYQTIFEADDPEVQAQQETNAEAQGKTENALIRAVKAVKAMISSLINAIADFLRKLTMSSEERKSFDEFKAACASDPSLKDKKITVQDYRNVMAQYDAMIKQLEEGMRNAENMKESKFKELMKNATDCISQTVKSTGMIVTADAALKMAQSNITIAKIINRGLKSDLGIMETLERELGSAKAAKKYQKKIAGCSRKISLQRLIVKFKKKEYDCAKDACAAAVNDLKSVATGRVWKNVSMTKHLIDNENTGKVIKTAANAGKGAIKIGAKGASMAVKEIINDKREEKRKEKEKKRNKGINKNGFDFIMGRKEDKEERIIKHYKKRINKAVKKAEKGGEKVLKKAGRELKKSAREQDRILKKAEKATKKMTEN